MADGEYILTETEDFVTTQAGQPYRLFPFGSFYKNGTKRTVTAKSAASFKLPHFKPPIKLGSHEDVTPAGGSIVALEVHEDGLYAVPEWTDKGAKVVDEGDYRYHSPEVIWEDSGIEDPTTGHLIPGPMILGDALLHTPHLGEAVAFYHFEKGEIPMDEAEKSLIERFTSAIERLFKRAEEAPEVEQVVQPVVESEPPVTESEEYKAAIVERDNLKTEIERLQAEKERADQLTALTRELQSEKYGSVYVSLATAEEAAGMLTGMTPEQREWVMRNFAALIAQIDESHLTGEVGSSGEGLPEDPALALNVTVAAKAEELKVSYAEALGIVIKERPELVAQYKK